MTPTRRRLTVVLIAACLGLAACGSDDGGQSPEAQSPEAQRPEAESTEQTPQAEQAALGRLVPEEFATRMPDAATVINVHIPYEGELESTSAFIPFDKIVGDSKLPADKSSDVLLYCMTGRMSEEAGNALIGAGYTNVSHLEAGMKAWEAAGKTLIQTPQSGDGADQGH